MLLLRNLTNFFVSLYSIVTSLSLTSLKFLMWSGGWEGVFPFFIRDLRGPVSPKAKFSPCKISSVTRQNLSSRITIYDTRAANGPSRVLVKFYVTFCATVLALPGTEDIQGNRRYFIREYVGGYPSPEVTLKLLISSRLNR